MKINKTIKTCITIIIICVIIQLFCVGYSTYNYFKIKSYYNCQKQGGFQIEAFGDCLLKMENWNKEL